MTDITTERFVRPDRAPGLRMPSSPANGLIVTGAQLRVDCAGADCSQTVLIDPRPLFGGRRFWPVSGRSERFRCRCGSRETRLSYTAGVVANDDPLNEDAICLWA